MTRKIIIMSAGTATITHRTTAPWVSYHGHRLQAESERPNNTELTFGDPFASCCEWLFRENRRVSPSSSTIEDIDFHTSWIREVRVPLPRKLRGSINHHRSHRHRKILLAEVSLSRRLAKGRSGLYRASRLFQELAMAKGDGSYAVLLSENRQRLGYRHAAIFCHGIRSTLITSSGKDCFLRL